MDVTCTFDDGLATIRLDVRNRDGSLDKAAWSDIQSDHDQGWRSVGLWALRYKGLTRCPGAELKWYFDSCPYVAYFTVKVTQVTDTQECDWGRHITESERATDQREPSKDEHIEDAPIDDEIIARIRSVILRDYPNGIVLSNSIVALLEKELGERFDERYMDRVRLDMFSRNDGTLLFPEMVMGADSLAQMKCRARELLDCYGMFAYETLRAEFGAEIRNLDDNRDFVKFFERFATEDLGVIIAGDKREKIYGKMCFGGLNGNVESDVESIIKTFDTIGKLKDCVRDKLVERGDAMSVAELFEQLPYLSRDVIEHVGEKLMPDVVTFELDGVRYLKLLEAFYLPDDFTRVVSDFIEVVEASRGVVSIVLLNAELERRYCEGFRVNFALEDDSVFKQVVLKSFKGSDHKWNRDMFLPHGKRKESNVAEMFLQSHQDIFHEEEFFKYARESRGINETGMLILTFLRKHCIRMSKEWWISLDGFDRKFGFTDIQYNEIGNVLNASVGNSRFKSIVALGDDVYERLPALRCDGKEYAWNPYVLTSVAVHRVRSARVVNDEPSPYTVTAMILPLDSIPSCAEQFTITVPS